MRTLKKTAAIAMSVVVLLTSGVTTKAAVTSAQPAKSSSEAELKWQEKVGEEFDQATWANNTLSKIKLEGNYIYAADDSNSRIMKIDKSTGKIVKQQDYYDKSYVQNYVGNLGIGGGKIYVEYNDGRIQAFDQNTLESLWITASTNNAIASELTYDNGKLYFGTTSGVYGAEGTNTTYSYYVLDTNDDNKEQTDEEKTMTKLMDSEGGNYYLKKGIKVGKYLIISDTTGKITSIDTENGNKIIDQKQYGAFSGNMALDASKNIVYFVVGDYSNNDNDLCGVKITSDGKFENESNVELYKTGYSATTPEVYNGKVYVSGTTGSPYEDPGYMAVVDVKSAQYKVNYTVTLPAYSQCEPTVVKTGTDSVRVYFTVNGEPGGVYAINDSNGATSSKLETIYEPEGAAKNTGCMSDVIVDTDGTIYYSNDSRYVFAIGKKTSKPTKPITKTQTSTRSINLTWKKNKSAKGYEIYVKSGKGSYKKLTTAGKTTKKTVSLKAGASYKFKVRPYKYTTKKGKKVKKYYKTYAAKVKSQSKTEKVVYKNVTGYTSYRIDMKVGNGSYKKVMTSNKKGTLTLTYTYKNAKVGKSYKFRLVGIKKVNGKTTEKTLK